MVIDIPEELMASWPADAQAFIRLLLQENARLRAEVAELRAEVAELKARLNKNSTNSSLPPSSGHPHAKPIKPSKQSIRKAKRRGGQPGHTKAERALIPTEECQKVVTFLPGECRKCGSELKGVDLEPIRHQVWELPEIKPIVTEYQRHRLTCTCGCSTCGVLPVGVPTGQAGPRLIAFSGLLMACFRQSKRRAAQFLTTILNQPASAGWMVTLQNHCSEAVKPAYDDLGQKLRAQEKAFIDESPSKEGKLKAWIWTLVMKNFTYFASRIGRGAEVLDELLGKDFKGVVHCDRAKMYFRFNKIQWCWAHLKRDFQSWIDSPCETKKRLGRDLMRETDQLFSLWKNVRDGTLKRSEFESEMMPIRSAVESLLLRGYCNPLTRSVCKELWTHLENLWIFVTVEGIEPTNNAAERSLRHAVIWRKLSFGTQSAAGSRFVERMLTAIETCRQQKRNVFEWMVQAVQARLHGTPPPMLVGG